MKFKREITKLLAVLALAIAISALMPPLNGQASLEERFDGPNFYTVKKGDCLWSIAEKFAVDPKLLAYANDMKPDEILDENRELFIPSGNTILYRVKNGDSLWSIAKDLNTSVEKLASDNEIDQEEKLQPDQTLVVTTGDTEQSDIPVTSSAIISSGSEDSDRGIPKLQIWPVHGRISSNFGPRDGRMHEGIDIAADYGSAIRAVADGVVVFAGKRGGYGNAVIINHGKGFRTLYGHASRLEVTAGENVREGQVIARVGSTGRSTGPHLHLETLYKGTPYNPLQYLP